MVPAVPLEEAIIARLTVLAHDKVFLGSLIKNSDTSSKSRLEHLGSLITAKEEARRRAERQRDGLMSVLAEAPGEKTKKAFLDKIEELTGQMEVMEGEKESLKQDRKNLASNIIDLEDAFHALTLR